MMFDKPVETGLQRISLNRNREKNGQCGKNGKREESSRHGGYSGNALKKTYSIIIQHNIQKSSIETEKLASVLIKTQRNDSFAAGDKPLSFPMRPATGSAFPPGAFARRTAASPIVSGNISPTFAGVRP
jgi:hypothetical protein